MAKKKNSPTFAPLPARALADTKLSALDLRVLGLVAFRDRFTRNGIGCFEKTKQMAMILRCHEKSVVRTLGTLLKEKYIEGDRHPQKRKLMVYRVIYTDADLATVKRPIGSETVSDDEPKGSETATDHDDADEPIGNETATDDPNGNEFATDEPFWDDADWPIGNDVATDHDRSVTADDLIGNKHFQEAEGFQDLTALEDNHVRDGAEALKINSEGSGTCGAAVADDDVDDGVDPDAMPFDEDDGHPSTSVGGKAGFGGETRPFTVIAGGRAPARDVDEAFDRFWAAYPRTSKPRNVRMKRAARKAFDRAVARGILPEDLVTGVQAYRAQIERAGFTRTQTKFPATWLREQQPSVLMADGTDGRA